jgi:hypothetical protein
VVGRLEVKYTYKDGKSLTSDLLTKAFNGRALLERRSELNMFEKEVVEKKPRPAT